MRPAAALLLASLLALLTNPAVQAQYTFTLIADSTSPTFQSFSARGPSLSAAGTVAFFATLDSGDTGIFTGAGGATAPIALSSGPTFAGFGFPSINATGRWRFVRSSMWATRASSPARAGRQPPSP